MSPKHTPLSAPWIFALKFEFNFPTTGNHSRILVFSNQNLCPQTWNKTLLIRKFWNPRQNKYLCIPNFFSYRNLNIQYQHSSKLHSTKFCIRNFDLESRMQKKARESGLKTSKTSILQKLRQFETSNSENEHLSKILLFTHLVCGLSWAVTQARYFPFYVTGFLVLSGVQHAQAFEFDRPAWIFILFERASLHRQCECLCVPNYIDS